MEYHWYFVWHLFPWLPLLAFLILLFRKANRKPAAWAIMIPVVIVYVPIVVFSVFATADLTLVTSGVLFVAAILALADWFTHHDGRGARWRRLLLFALTASVLVTPCTADMSTMVSILNSFLIMMTIALVCVLSLWLGVRIARRYKSLPLFVLAVLIIPAMGMVGLTIVMFVVFISQSGVEVIDEALMLLIPVSVSALSMGVITIIMILPFVLLVIASRFYRKRMIEAFVPSLMPIPVARVVPVVVPPLPEEE